MKKLLLFTAALMLSLSLGAQELANFVGTGNTASPEIKDGKWYINGEEVGPAVGANGENGDSFFKNVVVNHFLIL